MSNNTVVRLAHHQCYNQMDSATDECHSNLLRSENLKNVMNKLLLKLKVDIHPKLLQTVKMGEVSSFQLCFKQWWISPKSFRGNPSTILSRSQIRLSFQVQLIHLECDISQKWQLQQLGRIWQKWIRFILFIEITM